MSPLAGSKVLPLTACVQVNDNIDMYTRRDDDGSGRPDTTNYHLTSVRESNP